MAEPAARRRPAAYGSWAASGSLFRWECDGRRIDWIPLYGYIADRAELADATPQLSVLPLLDDEPPIRRFSGAVRSSYDPWTATIRIILAIQVSLATECSRRSWQIPDIRTIQSSPLLEEPVVVPEPATDLLVGGGMATLVGTTAPSRRAESLEAGFVSLDSKRRTPGS